MGGGGGRGILNPNHGNPRDGRRGWRCQWQQPRSDPSTNHTMATRAQNDHGDGITKIFECKRKTFFQNFPSYIKKKYNNYNNNEDNNCDRLPKGTNLVLCKPKDLHSSYIHEKDYKVKNSFINDQIYILSITTKSD